MTARRATTLKHTAAGIALSLAIGLTQAHNPNHVTNPAQNPSGYHPPPGHQLLSDHGRCLETNPPTYTLLRRRPAQDCL